jgi:hypothetical protein
MKAKKQIKYSKILEQNGSNTKKNKEHEEHPKPKPSNVNLYPD